MKGKTIYRILTQGIIGGVCACVIERYGMKPDTVRYLHVFGHFFGLPMIVVYLFEWFEYPVKE